MSTEAIQAAQLAYQAAKDAEQTTRAALKAAEAVSATAYEALHQARVLRDRALPQAVIKTTEWHGRKSSSLAVCIVRQTAKAAFVRSLGSDNEAGDQYRLNKYGKWKPYPSESSLSYTQKELVFGEVAA